MKMWVVWNADKTEGAVFGNENDAMHAAGVIRINPCSTLADAFRDIYVDNNPDDEEECSVEQVALPLAQ